MIPALVLTNLVAFTLITFALSHWESSFEFAQFVTTNRSAVGIVVQIISYLLGLIHVSTLSESKLTTEQLEVPGQVLKNGS